MEKMTRLASFAGIALGLIATPLWAQSGPPTFYNLSNDLNGLELIELDSIAGSGSHSSAVLITLLRGQKQFGVINTWQVDCTRHRQQIIKTMTFAPGSHGAEHLVKGEAVPSDATPQSRTLFNLVCSGNGNLAANRTSYEQLPDIIRSFWGQ